MKRHYFDVQFEKNETYFAFCLGKINFAKKRFSAIQNKFRFDAKAICEKKIRINKIVSFY